MTAADELRRASEALDAIAVALGGKRGQAWHVTVECARLSDRWMAEVCDQRDAAEARLVERCPAALLEEFHRAFGCTRRDVRRTLHEEEHAELIDALGQDDRTAIAHELADVVYVAYGTAFVWGIDLDAAIAEVHRANMSKLDADGRPIHRDDGKVLKSDRYRPPDIAAVLAARDGAR